jgi:hypothetical protein
MKVRDGWRSGKGLRTDVDGKQMRCLTADEGHVWMHVHDQLPPAVRQRLAESAYNLCAACVQIEARQAAHVRGRGRTTVSDYFEVIRAIERELAVERPKGRSVVRKR